MPLIPVALGGILSAIVAELCQGAPRPLAITLAAGAALLLLAFALGRFAPRVAFFAALALYAAFLENAGGTALAKSLGSLAEGPLALGPWILACFGVWLGREPSLDELRGRARRVLVPLGVLLAVDVLIELAASQPGVQAAFEAHPRVQTLLLGLGVFTIFVAGPWVIRLLFATKKIDLSIEGVPVRLVELGVPVSTAVVAGAFRRLRTIFVTPALIRNMNPPENAAVLRHELGHGELGHLRTVGLVAAAGLVLADDLEPLGAWVALIGLVAVVGFLVLARRLEHDADLYAALPGGENAWAVESALLKCCVANGQPIEKGGWRHPSVERRIEVIRRAANEPGYAERRLRRSRALLGALSGAALLLIATQALRAFVEFR